MKTLFALLAAILLPSLPTTSFAQSPTHERGQTSPAPNTQPKDNKSESSVKSWSTAKMGTFAGTWSLTSVLVHPDPRLGDMVIIENKEMKDVPMLAFTVTNDAAVDNLFDTVTIELSEGTTPDKASLKFLAADGKVIYSITSAPTCVGLKPRRKAN